MDNKQIEELQAELKVLSKKYNINIVTPRCVQDVYLPMDYMVLLSNEQDREETTKIVLEFKKTR